MKRITLLLLFLGSFAIHAQERRVSATVEQLNSTHHTFKQYSPLTAATTPPRDKAVKNATYANLNAAAVKEIAKTKPQYIEVTIPYNSANVVVQLYRVQILAKGFHMDTKRQKDVAYHPGAYYRGVVKDDPKSLASLNFFDGEMNGIVSGKGINNLVVGKLKNAKTKNTPAYIIYSDSKLAKHNEFLCVTPEGAPFGKKQSVTAARSGDEATKCVGVYFEMDYAIYQANNNSETLTANWMTSLFNNIQTLFDNDGIDVMLQSFYVHTEQDPYDENSFSSNDYLEKFLLRWFEDDFDGDIGQLIGIDSGGYGGLAVLNGLCSYQNVSYVDIDYDFEDVPLFSWNVEAMTHEIGHQLGSDHTHACVWNGNNTAIDGCGTFAGIIEGDCEMAEIPYETQGTIMSYCHLLGDVGINLANGFGPQPSQRIRDYVDSSNCLAIGCLTDCENPITAFTVNTLSNTSVSISWDASGNWQRSTAALVDNYTLWDTISGNNVTLTDLTPNSYYKMALRIECEGGASRIQEVVFATGADWCGETQFFADSGGIEGEYGTNEHFVRTLTPSPLTKLVVEFGTFNLEEGYDVLSIYDGPDTNAPLIGMYSGENSPGTITSTAEDGSLTFEFISDIYETRSGWIANVGCTEPTAGLAEVAFANFTYYPNPAKNSVTIASSEDLGEISIYNIAGQLLSVQKANGSRAVANISAFATGVYFFKVSNGTKVANFRIVKQD